MRAIHRSESGDAPVSTGTSASTAKFYDAWNSTYSSNGNTYQQSSYPLAFTVAGGKLYFVANNATNGQELYVSDGTTTSVVDIYSGVSGSGPTALVAHQGALWFRANNGTNGNDLMSYDGSTLTARDIVAGASGPNWSTSTGVVSAGGGRMRTSLRFWSNAVISMNSGLVA